MQDAPDDLADRRRRKALAAAVREIRASKQLQQEVVGERGGLGRKYVGQLERAEISPSFVGVARVAEGLGVPLSELVGLYEERLRRPR